MKFDAKDIRLGFWLGAGLFLFSLVLGMISWLTHRAVGGSDNRG